MYDPQHREPGQCEKSLQAPLARIRLQLKPGCSGQKPRTHFGHVRAANLLYHELPSRRRHSSFSFSDKSNSGAKHASSFHPRSKFKETPVEADDPLAA